MRRIISTAVFAVFLGQAQALSQASATLAFPGDEVLLRMSATGVQVYECRAPAGGTPAWAFKEPRAQLLIAGQPVGRHYAGPTWEYSDGSRIVGKVVTIVQAPRPEDIPWLRLTVATHVGNGALGAVTVVQRVNTKGGVLSGACADAGTISEAPYTADYVMIRGAP